MLPVNISCNEETLTMCKMAQNLKTNSFHKIIWWVLFIYLFFKPEVNNNSRNEAPD